MTLNTQSTEQRICFSKLSTESVLHSDTVKELKLFVTLERELYGSKCHYLF